MGVLPETKLTKRVVAALEKRMNALGWGAQIPYSIQESAHGVVCDILRMRLNKKASFVTNTVKLCVGICTSDGSKIRYLDGDFLNQLVEQHLPKGNSMFEPLVGAARSVFAKRIAALEKAAEKLMQPTPELIEQQRKKLQRINKSIATGTENRRRSISRDLLTRSDLWNEVREIGPKMDSLIKANCKQSEITSRLSMTVFRAWKLFHAWERYESGQQFPITEGCDLLLPISKYEEFIGKSAEYLSRVYGDDPIGLALSDCLDSQLTTKLKEQQTPRLIRLQIESLVRDMIEMAGRKKVEDLAVVFQVTCS